MTRQTFSLRNISPSVRANGILDSAGSYLLHVSDASVGIVEREKIFNCCEPFKVGLVGLVLLQQFNIIQCGIQAISLSV